MRGHPERLAAHLPVIHTTSGRPTFPLVRLELLYLLTVWGESNATGSPAHINPITMSFGLLDDLNFQQHGTGTPGACSSMAQPSPGDDLLSQQQSQEQPTGDRRVTSRFRGLYFDVKHSSWRVRIFFQ